MKKKLLMTLLLASCVCFAAGCSSSKKETEAPAKTETEAKAETEAPAKEAASEAAAAVNNAVEAASEAVDGAVEAASEAVDGAVEAASEAVEGAAEAADNAVEAASEAVDGAVEAASEAVDGAVEAASEAAEDVAEAADNAVEAASEVVDGAVEAASEAAEDVAEAADNAVEAASEAVDGAVEAASEAAEDVAEAADNAVEAASEAVEEAASEAEALVEEAASEAAAVVEEAASEALPEETEIMESAVEDIVGVESDTEEEVLEEGTEAAEESALEEETEAADESALEEGTEAADEDVLEDETEVVQFVELGERPKFTAKDYVTIGTYKGLMAEVTKAEVTDADVEGEMEIDIEMGLEEKDLYKKITEGTVADGDTVNIDYVGRIDGEEFEGGSGNYDLEIGSGSFIEGFEEGLIGAEIGSEIELPLTFPEDYYAEMAGKDVVFTVTVNYKKESPEVSDDLIYGLTDGEYKTVDEYRAYEKEKLEEQAAESQKSEAYNELMTQLYNTFTINSLPEDLIEYSMTSARNQYLQMAQMYGMSYEDMISAYGVDQATFEGYLRQDVEASLKQEMILSAIAEEEGLSVSEEEYKEGLQKYAETYGYDSPEQFEEAYSKSDIETSLLMNKVIELVYDNAVITETEPATEDLELDLLTEDESEEEIYYEETEMITE